MHRLLSQLDHVNPGNDTYEMEIVHNNLKTNQSNLVKLMYDIPTDNNCIELYDLLHLISSGVEVQKNTLARLLRIDFEFIRPMPKKEIKWLIRMIADHYSFRNKIEYWLRKLIMPFISGRIILSFADFGFHEEYWTMRKLQGKRIDKFLPKQLLYMRISPNINYEQYKKIYKLANVKLKISINNFIRLCKYHKFKFADKMKKYIVWPEPSEHEYTNIEIAKLITAENFRAVDYLIRNNLVDANLQGVEEHTVIKNKKIYDYLKSKKTQIDYKCAFLVLTDYHQREFSDIQFLKFIYSKCFIRKNIILYAIHNRHIFDFLVEENLIDQHGIAKTYLYVRTVRTYIY